jgi:putative transposase
MLSRCGPATRLTVTDLFFRSLFAFFIIELRISQSDPRRRHKKSYRCLDRTYRFGRPPPMERGRSISSVIMMASLGSALSELRRRVESRFSKHLITFRKRMPSVNVFSEVCDASVSITCSSCMRSNSSGYSTLMYATRNRARPHQGIKQQIPERSAGSAPEDHTCGKDLAFPILGGLHHDYCRSA